LNLQRDKRKAKRKWQEFFARKCQHKNFKSNLKDAWDMVFKLIEGFQDHRQFSQKNFKDQNGHITLTDTENTELLRKHYHKVLIAPSQSI